MYFNFTRAELEERVEAGMGVAGVLVRGAFMAINGSCAFSLVTFITTSNTKRPIIVRVLRPLSRVSSLSLSSPPPLSLDLLPLLDCH